MVEKVEMEKVEVEKVEVEKVEVEKEVENAEVKKVEKHIGNINCHCKYDFMNHIYTISLPFLAKCTSLRNTLMIFLFARSRSTYLSKIRVARSHIREKMMKGITYYLHCV